MERFTTIKQDVIAELTEKKSKFIATVFYVETIEEVETKIKDIKKQYVGARHYCYAYRTLANNQIIEKSSDDGEPSRNSRSTITKSLAKT